MDLSLTQDQQDIREAVLKHCSPFTDDYWLERDRDGNPAELYEAARVDGAGRGRLGGRGVGSRGRFDPGLVPGFAFRGRRGRFGNRFGGFRGRRLKFRPARF